MLWHISGRKEGETMAEKNTMQRELTCICCPVGCALTVTMADDNSVTVTGNRCPRGAAYGEKEVTNPTRIVTSTVRVAGYPDIVVSVKTATDIPKGKINDCHESTGRCDGDCANSCRRCHRGKCG